MTTVSIDTLCKLLDLKPRRIQYLVTEGIIPRTERGQYEVVPAVRNYIQYIRDRDLVSDGSEGSVDHKLRLTKARADIAEIEAAQLAGTVVSIDNVCKVLGAQLSACRARLLVVPSKIAPLVQVAAETGEAEAIIRDAIYEALQELSEGRLIEEATAAVEAEESAAEDFGEADLEG